MSANCKKYIDIFSYLEDMTMVQPGLLDWFHGRKSPPAGWTSRSLHNKESDCCHRLQRAGPPHPLSSLQRTVFCANFTKQNHPLSAPAKQPQPNRLGPWKHQIALRVLGESDLHLQRLNASRRLWPSTMYHHTFKTPLQETRKCWNWYTKWHVYNNNTVSSSNFALSLSHLWTISMITYFPLERRKPDEKCAYCRVSMWRTCKWVSM